MKIKISIGPGDEQDGAKAVQELSRLFPAARVRESDKNPPFKVVYLTTKPPANPHKTRDNI